MSKPSNNSVTSREKQNEGSNVDSSEDPEKDSSPRDVNLNSKKFADCNLYGSVQENGEIKNSDLKKTKLEESSSKPEENQTIWENDEKEEKELSQLENSFELSSEKDECESFPMVISSTPKSEPPGFQRMGNLFSTSNEVSPVEAKFNDQTFVVAKGILSRNTSLSDEELSKKFQDLSFSFKTDSMTIQKRLSVMKKRKDQSELNIENELTTVKSKLNSLQYLGSNSDYVNLISDLKKQMDFVLNATFELSNSAESYGYVEHEEKLLEFVSVMIKHVENLENSKNEATKILEKLKAEGKRANAIILDSDGEEERVLRRRSVAAMAIEGSSRRRASIATLPRLPASVLEGGNNGKSSQWLSSSRNSGIVNKKLMFGQQNSRSHSNSQLAEEPRRDSIGSRHRKDSWTSDSSMKNIEESPEQRFFSLKESDSNEVDENEGSENGARDPTTSFKELQESFEEFRRNSLSQETTNLIYCLRRIIEWNKKLLGAARFRWPDNFFQYVPFYLTWYVVFILALIFIGGLIAGINGCYTYLRLPFLSMWFAVLTSLLLTRRFYRILFLLFFSTTVFLLVLFLFFTNFILPGLTDEELEELLTSFGLVLEIQYLNGSPPS